MFFQKLRNQLLKRLTAIAYKFKGSIGLKVDIKFNNYVSSSQLVSARCVVHHNLLRCIGNKSS